MRLALDILFGPLRILSFLAGVAWGLTPFRLPMERR